MGATVAPEPKRGNVNAFDPTSYTEPTEARLSLRDYCGSGYGRINKALRGLRYKGWHREHYGVTYGEPSRFSLDRLLMGQVHGIDSLMRPGPEQTVYRGVSERSAPLRVGEWMDPAFMSTSSSESAAFDPGASLEILLPEGFPRVDVNAELGDDSPYEDEKEVLLPRGTVLRVVSREEVDNGWSTKIKITAVAVRCHGWNPDTDTPATDEDRLNAHALDVLGPEANDWAI
jgi:hypothetical protein